ncbi:MAG: hypothetical protein AB7I50_07410, partial [Vicinamibacterales bacterium]
AGPRCRPDERRRARLGPVTMIPGPLAMTESPLLLTAEQLNLLARFATQPRTVLATCLLILAGGAWAVYWVTKQCRHTTRAVESGVATLVGVDTPRHFTARLDGLSRELGAHPLLGADWRRFQGGLIKPHESVPYVRTPVDPRAVFRLDSHVGAHLNLRLAQAVPSYLTGAGIFFTFAGLVAGIHLGGSSLASNNSALVMAALGDLLNGASLAFATSMTGLFASIGVSLYEKSRFAAVSRALDAWHERLRGLVPVVSAERLAAEQLEEQERQTQQLEKFNTELAISVATALDARLGDRLGPIFDRLQVSLDNLAARQAAFSNELLSDVGRQISGAITGAAGEELKAAGEAIRKTSEAMGDTAQAVTVAKESLAKAAGDMVTNLGASFEQGSSRLAQTMDDVLQRMTTGLTAAASGVRDDLVAGAEGLRAAVNGCETVVQRSAELADRFRKAVEDVNDVLGEIAEAHSGLKATTAALVTAADASASAGDAVRQQVEAIAAAATSLEKASGTMATVQSTLEQSWANYEQRFVAIDEVLGNTVTELTKGADAYTQQVMELHRALDRELSKAMSDIAGAVGDLHESVEDLQDALATGPKA